MGYADKLGEQARNALAAAEAQRLLNAEMRDQVELARDQLELLRRAPALIDDMRTADLALRRQVSNAPRPLILGPDGFPVDSKGGRLPPVPTGSPAAPGAVPALRPVSSGGGGGESGGGGGGGNTRGGGGGVLRSRAGQFKPREWLGAHCRLVEVTVLVFGRKDPVTIRAYDCTDLLGEGAIFELPEDRRAFLPPGRSWHGGASTTTSAGSGTGSSRSSAPTRTTLGGFNIGGSGFLNPPDGKGLVPENPAVDTGGRGRLAPRTPVIVTTPAPRGPTEGERDIRRGLTSVEAVLVKIHQAIERGSRDDGGTLLRARGLV